MVDKVMVGMLHMVHILSKDMVVITSSGTRHIDRRTKWAR